MCGIVGVLSKSPLNKSVEQTLHKAVQKLAKRGPDFQSVYLENKIALGHARLSILDTSDAGNQPMLDNSKR